jgi:hypothetical protein
MNVQVLALATMLFLLPFASQAAPLFANGAPAGDSLRCAESSGVCGASWTVFDNFQLAAPSAISSVSWMAYLYGGTEDLAGVRAGIYSADPVLGGGQLLHAIDDSALRVTPDQSGAYAVTLGGLNLNLAAGTYWLGMQHLTHADFATIACANSCGAGYSTQWGTVDNAVMYRFSSTMDYAFTIEGRAQPAATVSVPEPATLGLLLVAMLGAVMGRRRTIH